MYMIYYDKHSQNVWTELGISLNILRQELKLRMLFILNDIALLTEKCHAHLVPYILYTFLSMIFNILLYINCEIPEKKNIYQIFDIILYFCFESNFMKEIKIMLENEN